MFIFSKIIYLSKGSLKNFQLFLNIELICDCLSIMNKCSIFNAENLFIYLIFFIYLFIIWLICFQTMLKDGSNLTISNYWSFFNSWMNKIWFSLYSFLLWGFIKNWKKSFIKMIRLLGNKEVGKRLKPTLSAFWYLLARIFRTIRTHESGSSPSRSPILTNPSLSLNTESHSHLISTVSKRDRYWEWCTGRGIGEETKEGEGLKQLEYGKQKICRHDRKFREFHLRAVLWLTFKPF